VLITVQRAHAKDQDDLKLQNVGKPSDMLMTETEYKDMHPYETDEYRQLAQSSFDNLLWLAKKISTVQGMLTGKEGDDLLTLATEVESTLGELGGSAAQITKELKGSGYARSMAKSTFKGFFDRLKGQEIQVKERHRVRRQIRRKGLDE
jgi:hypothetical protein